MNRRLAEYALDETTENNENARALLRHDSGRGVRASLRFTAAVVEESVEWSAERISEIEAELRSMLTALE